MCTHMPLLVATLQFVVFFQTPFFKLDDLQVEINFNFQIQSNYKEVEKFVIVEVHLIFEIRSNSDIGIKFVITTRLAIRIS